MSHTPPVSPNEPIELGITVLPEYAQSEGIEEVLSKVCDVAGATSITTSPYVVSEAAVDEGEREPPIDGGAGKRRLLDRALWGKREVWMKAAPSFQPNVKLYKGLKYMPPDGGALTQNQGAIVGDFLKAAKARGMETWMQVMAASPPGHRVQFGAPHDDDRPLLPDGSVYTGRVDNNASLASEDLRAYMRAFIQDVSAAYPDIDGFKFDWPEYPAYHFQSLFFDFNSAVEPYADRLGIQFGSLKSGTAAFLEELSNGDIRRKKISLDDLQGFSQSLVEAYPALSDLKALKTLIVEDYAKFLRDAVAEASDGRQLVFLQSFPPPLNSATGFDFERLGQQCDMVGVKCYTMHWPLIEKHLLEALRTRTDFSTQSIVRALTLLLGFSDDPARNVTDIRYPEPDAPHPAPSSRLTEKMRLARAAIPKSTRMCGITHAYGPVDDVLRRLDAVAAGANACVHVNRYAYLSDDKLEAIGTRT